MIPKGMESFLKERLPQRTFQNRLIEDGCCRYMEFGPLDVDRLARLGIEVDNLGPNLVVCMWDDDAPLEIGGYLVVDNLAMGRVFIAIDSDQIEQHTVKSYSGRDYLMRQRATCYALFDLLKLLRST